MGVFEHFPYTNFHDMNLDWILKKIAELIGRVDSDEEKLLPPGGLPNQVLVKHSAKDFDTIWSEQAAGPQGPQGPQGIPGSAATITIDSTTTGIPGTPATVVNTGTTLNAKLKFTIPRGADGRSFTIKGLYSTYSDLIAAHPTGQTGDAYAVGTTEENTIYFWSVDTATWTDIGPIKGEKGDTGAQGPAGVGVPAGGLKGKALGKLSGADYNTGWLDMVQWDDVTPYATGAYCTHKGYLWVNTSGASSIDVEPGTNYNVWNVTYANKNLLDNGDFKINQRDGYVAPIGVGMYQEPECINLLYTTSIVYKAEIVSSGNYKVDVSGTLLYIKAEDVVKGYTIEYGVDRFYAYGNISYTVDDDGITVNGKSGSVLNQYIEKLNDGIYTLSVKTDNGIVVRRFNVNGTTVTLIDGEEAEWGSLTLGYEAGRTAYYFQIYFIATAEIEIKKAMLEFGEVSTIANWQSDYATELLKCQRYFQIFKTQSLRHIDKDDFRPVMRVNPSNSTISISGTTYFSSSADL